MNIYETDQLLSEYLLFHYGAEEDILPQPFGPRDALHFPVRCVSELLPIAGRKSFGKALDIGCAVGRSSFELSRVAAEVVGVDFSARFVDAANYMKDNGKMTFAYAQEGKRVKECVARLPENMDRSRVRFETGDAQSLPSELDGMDLVLASNLICRLQEPRRFFDRLPQLVKKDGIFLLCSPYTWLENFTPVENWLGSRHASDRSAFETIRDILSTHFDFLGERDLPFLIREHARKYQWSISHGTVWRRQ